MDVVIDTNIFISDPKLKSSDWDILIDYLYKTDSSVFLPKVVNEEIKAVYKRRLQTNLSKYKSSIDSINGLVVDKINPAEIDIDEQARKTLENILRKLKINKKQLIGHDPSYLDQAIYRAINRIKPCSENKEEFRDTLIWLTLIDLAKKSSERVVAFISKNTKDFFRDRCLHPDLQKDLDKNKIKIFCFASLAEFIKEHSKKIDRYSIQELEKKVNIESLNEDIYDEIFLDIEPIKRYIRRKDCEPLEYLELTSYQFSFKDVSVYEMLDEDHFYIQAELYDEIEVEAEVYKDYSTQYDRVGSTEIEYFYIEMRAVVNFIFHGDKLTKKEINFVEPYF